MSLHGTQFPRVCARCAERLTGSSMSRYNSDVLCMACLTDERSLPSYAACEAAELAAVKRGNYNFHYGLSSDDRTTLAQKLAARRAMAMQEAQ